MVYVFVTIIPYIIAMIALLFYKRKRIKDGKKPDSMDLVIITLFGNGMFAFNATDSNLSNNMKATVIGICTILFLIFSAISYILEIKQDIKRNK